jgi:hypothetical protein
VLSAHLHARAQDLYTWQYDDELNCKLWQLKRHAAALRAPLLLPGVEPVRDEAPADADEALTGDNLLTYSHTTHKQGRNGAL